MSRSAPRATSTRRPGEARGEIVDQGEHAQHTAVAEGIRDKIHRPARVWLPGRGKRHARNGDPFPPPPAHLQARVPVDALDALAVNDLPIAAETPVQPTIAPARFQDRQRLQLRPQHCIVACAPVALRRSREACIPTRLALGELRGAPRCPDRRPALGCGPHVFPGDPSEGDCQHALTDRSDTTLQLAKPASCALRSWCPCTSPLIN